MKRRYNSPKSIWPQEKVKPEKQELKSDNIKPENIKLEKQEEKLKKPLEPFIVTNELRLFWTLGLVSVGILILITLSLLLATLQNARLLSILISKK